MSVITKVKEKYGISTRINVDIIIYIVQIKVKGDHG
jgi:hypothetical protein